jgi:hypothetical protein
MGVLRRGDRDRRRGPRAAILRGASIRAHSSADRLTDLFEVRKLCPFYKLRFLIDWAFPALLW